MKMQIFSVYDVKAECYLTPFFQNTVAQGIRAFEDINENPNTVINKHPEDFSLYHIGVFDVSSGKIESFPECRFLATPSLKNSQGE
jgi:hypothetical protein